MTASVAPAPLPLGQLHLLSWNVAGWKTTAEQVRRCRGGLRGLLEGHRADILCLQEVKLTARALAADALRQDAETPGFESFWACNDGSAAQRQGLNGVATLAREGTVLRADGAPLRDPDLDGEGRCLLTDHGPFVVFNVYVPNSAGGPRLPFKLRWLAALRSAMARERAAGKAVVLAGDLNMKSRSVDSHWAHRPLRVGALRALTREERGALGPEGEAAAEAICGEWAFVAEALRRRVCQQIETRNSQTGRAYSKWGVFASAKSGNLVRLGAPFETEEGARLSFAVDGIGVEEDGSVALGGAAVDAAHLLHGPGALSMGDLAECMKRLAEVEIPLQAQKRLADACGSLAQAPAVTRWLQAVLREDGMVDTFAELHPRAEERFTCWDQYKNRRYENIGARIDYVLVDRAFFERHALRGAPLASHRGLEPDSAAAAAAAATLGGLSQPAPFAGGGMGPMEPCEYAAQFREGPSSGVVYTPPQLSDHVAVSLLLGGCPPPPRAGARGAETLRCQPHRSARRITDFFAKKRPAGEPAGAPAKRTAIGA